jgi:hypothetical protein
MGGITSKMRTPPPRRVALVGLTETGKSHFLSVLFGDGTEVLAPTHGPTNGVDRMLCRQGSRAVEFVEFGWSILARGANGDFQTRQPFDTIVWFIDEHDTMCDVHEARSALLGFMETQSVPTSLCIVFNKGRPRARRRIIAGSRWIDCHASAQVAHWEGTRGDRTVSWDALREFVDITALSALFVTGIYCTELSYRDPQSAALCLEWIIDPEAVV